MEHPRFLGGEVVEIQASEWLPEVLDRTDEFQGTINVLYHSLFESASPQRVLGAWSDRPVLVQVKRPL